MCIPLGGNNKSPSPSPAPAPIPVPTPSEVSPQGASDARRRQLELLRYGLAGTIKTTARGVSGTGPNLAPQATGKQKLGA